MTKKELIDLLSNEPDDMRIDVHMDVKPCTDYRGDCLREDKKSMNVVTVKFVVFR